VLARLAPRIALSAGLLVVAAVVAFGLLQLVPGDAATLILAARGPGEAPTPEEVGRLRAELGLDAPAPVRFLRWAGSALVGDLGDSYRTGRPVAAELGPRIGRTAILGLAAALVSVTLSLAAGLRAALRVGAPFDRAFLAVTSLLAATPVFVLGMALAGALALALGVLPAAGDDTPAHYVLPALTLGLAHAAAPARVLRRGLLEEVPKPYAVAALARGASARDVVEHHALRNAAVPFATLSGLSLRSLLGGSVLVESVFDVRGVGTFLVDSVAFRDVPAVLACVLLFVAVTAAVNLATDVACAAIDPRIRLAGGPA
jgi:ABC-type dipeptide/oligopeptide/nickel transport system permease component